MTTNHQRFGHDKDREGRDNLYTKITMFFFTLPCITDESDKSGYGAQAITCDERIKWYNKSST